MPEFKPHEVISSQAEILPISPLLTEVRERRALGTFEEVQSTIDFMIRYTGKPADLLMYDYMSRNSDETTIPVTARMEADSSLTVASTRFGLDVLDQVVSEGQGQLRKVVTKLDEGKVHELKVTDNMSIQFKKLKGDRFATRFVTNDDESEASIRDFWGLRDRLREADNLTPAIKKLGTEIKRGELSSYSDAVFDFGTTPDALITFLSISSLSLGLDARMDMPTAGKIKTGIVAVDTLYNKLPFHYPAETEGHPVGGMYFDENGRFQKALINTRTPGLYIAIRSANPESIASLEELALQIGLEIRTDEIYGVEASYNGYVDKSVKPLAETVAAAEMLKAFSDAGLGLSDRIKDSFAEVGQIEKRYGHGYADLTRELSKLVNDRNRSINTFFAGDPEEIIAKIAKLEAVEHPAAQAVIDILKQVTNRITIQVPDVAELDASGERVELRDGSCKDIEVYAEGSRTIAEEGSLFRTAYSRPTFIALRPVKLNGVILPAGSLLLREKDGYLFMRITSFAFDRNTDKEVFGAQFLENTAATGGNLDISYVDQLKGGK